MCLRCLLAIGFQGLYYISFNWIMIFPLINFFLSFRLPDMIPSYQAFTGSPCYNNNVYPKKEDPIPPGITTNREQSPFSRNTPERATIQHVPQNKRERIQLEKQVLSGVGGPSGPSNLPIALGGSISHPQPPKKDKTSSHYKKSSDECLTEQPNSSTIKSKKKSVNSFFKSLTTKISKKFVIFINNRM